jgi:DNA-directed RNA polymerase specialized sigma24 family protein
MQEIDGTDRRQGHEWLAEQFEANRAHLKAVAYRMLGSPSEADDAVQEAWLRFSRADTGSIQNLAGWLTAVVARICLDMLRSRNSRREEPMDAPPFAPYHYMAISADSHAEAQQRAYAETCTRRDAQIATSPCVSTTSPPGPGLPPPTPASSRRRPARLERVLPPRGYEAAHP